MTPFYTGHSFTDHSFAKENSMPFLCIAFGCLLSLCLAVSVSAQNEAEKVPSLQDAKTPFDIIDYINYESDKINNKDTDPKQKAALRADVFMRASDKMLEIAKDNNDRHNAYSIRLTGFQRQIEAEIEGAQQRMEAFLDDLAAKDDTRYKAEELRFRLFTSEAMKTINTPEGVSAFQAGLKTWIYRNIDSSHMFIRADRIGRAILHAAEIRGRMEPQVAESREDFAAEWIEELIEFIQSAECTLSAKEKETAVREFEQILEMYRFGQFYRKALETVNSPESFDAFKAGLKEWINRKTVNVDEIPHLALFLAEKCGIPAEEIMNELIAFLQSPECTAPYKNYCVTEWKKLLLTAFGSDLKLYGRTLDDKNFDWESLRGKYVLVQFTATWCGPCHLEIPGMKAAYKKYHDKGFEIVSIYVFERGEDVVASIKEHVAHEELPWIIISEALTKDAGQPRYETSYGIKSVPTMLLVDQAGKIIMTNARGEALQTKLAEIFE